MITRLTETWQAGQRTFAARDLSQVGYVYLRAEPQRARAQFGVCGADSGRVHNDPNLTGTRMLG